jgi:hypothetical protein
LLRSFSGGKISCVHTCSRLLSDSSTFDLAAGRATKMATFLYRCPNTGLKVQGWVADDPTKDEDFKPVTCTACARVHLVNPKSGKVAGTDK